MLGRYNDLIQDETKLTEEEIIVKNAGKVDPKKGLVIILPCTPFFR